MMSPDLKIVVFLYLILSNGSKQKQMLLPSWTGQSSSSTGIRWERDNPPSALCTARYHVRGIDGCKMTATVSKTEQPGT